MDQVRWRFIDMLLGLFMLPFQIAFWGMVILLRIIWELPS